MAIPPELDSAKVAFNYKAINKLKIHLQVYFIAL